MKNALHERLLWATATALTALAAVAGALVGLDDPFAHALITALGHNG